MNLEHHPGPYDHLVSKGDTNEKALQRAIIALKSSNLGDKKISWIDIELPMQEGKTKTKRFDLIGETSKGDYVLCELKFAKGTSKGDTPEDATTQIIKYRDTIVDYFKRLKAANQNFNLHTNAAYPQLDLDKCIDQPIQLVVAANKKYWEMHPDFSRNPSVKYASINVEEDWFSKLAEKATEPDGTYKPTMPEFARIWSIV